MTPEDFNQFVQIALQFLTKTPIVGEQAEMMTATKNWLAGLQMAPTAPPAEDDFK